MESSSQITYLLLIPVVTHGYMYSFHWTEKIDHLTKQGVNVNQMQSANVAALKHLIIPILVASHFIIINFGTSQSITLMR